jgi:hypothetical protein
MTPGTRAMTPPGGTPTAAALVPHRRSRPGGAGHGSAAVFIVFASGLSLAAHDPAPLS